MLHTVAVRGAGAEGRRSAVVARYLSRSARAARTPQLSPSLVYGLARHLHWQAQQNGVRHKSVARGLQKGRLV